VNADCGILAGNPEWDQHDIVVLALTPGIPLEWIYAALGLGQIRRRRLRDMIDAANRDQVMPLAEANAASVVQGDGWKMLEAVCPGYAGAVPFWSQIELRQDPRSDGAIARVLRVDRQKVRRWRVKPVFCPLTMVRLVPNRGLPVGRRAAGDFAL